MVAYNSARPKIGMESPSELTGIESKGVSVDFRAKVSVAHPEE